MTGANMKYPEAVGAMSDVPELMNLVTGYYAGDPAAIEAARKAQADGGHDRFALTNLAKMFPPPPEKHTNAPPSPLSPIASYFTPETSVPAASQATPPAPASTTPGDIKPVHEKRHDDDDSDVEDLSKSEVHSPPKTKSQSDDHVDQATFSKAEALSSVSDDNDDDDSNDDDTSDNAPKKKQGPPSREVDPPKIREEPTLRNTKSASKGGAMSMMFGDDDGDDGEDDDDVSNDDDAPSSNKPLGMFGSLESMIGMGGGDDKKKPPLSEKSFNAAEKNPDDKDKQKNFHTDGETDKALDNMYNANDSAVKRLFNKHDDDNPTPAKHENPLSSMMHAFSGSAPHHLEEANHNPPAETHPVDYLALASTAMKAAKGEANKVDLMKAMESMAPSMGDKLGLDPSMIQMAQQGLSAMESIEGDPNSAGKDTKQKMFDVAGPLLAKQMGVDPSMVKMAGPLIGMM